MNRQSGTLLFGEARPRGDQRGSRLSTPDPNRLEQLGGGASAGVGVVGAGRAVGAGGVVGVGGAVGVRGVVGVGGVVGAGRAGAGVGGVVVSGRAGAGVIEAPDILSVPDLDDKIGLSDIWMVIVWNDPVNLMSYVTYVFQKLFAYSKEKATKLMLQVHNEGRAVVASGPQERAEHDVYRLQSHGLWATLERSG